MRAGALAAVLIGAVFVLGGCQYLLGLGNGGLVVPIPPANASFDPGVFDSFDPGVFQSFDPAPDASLPAPIAALTRGSATITIGGSVTKLGRLTEPGVVYQDLGAETSWTDGKGTYVQFYSGDQVDPSARGGYIQLDRIRSGQHWAIDDPTACVVTVKQVSTKGLSGTASCKGLHWTDTMSGFGGDGPNKVPGEPAFDAEITFQAAP